MLKTFDDFLKAYPRYTKYCRGTVLENAFNDIVSKEANIIKMIQVIQNGVTPISIIAKEIEQYVSSHPDETVTLDRNVDEKRADTCRQAIGAMIATVISPFGYEKIKGQNRPIPLAYKGDFLSTGATYQKTGTATMQIVLTIVPIE